MNSQATSRADRHAAWACGGREGKSYSNQFPCRDWGQHVWHSGTGLLMLGAMLAASGCATPSAAQPPVTADSAPARVEREESPPCVCECPPHGQALGRTVWSKRFGDEASQQGSSIATDRLGNVLVMGGFTGTLDLGAQPLRSSGRRDLFLAKFDTEGVLRWSRAFGSKDTQGHCGGRAVAADRDGNIFLAGDFSGSLQFDNQTIKSDSSYDVFLAKLSPEGKVLWSRRFGGDGRDLASGLSVDHVGNVFLTGEFRGTIDFGGGPLASAGDVDIFLAKIDPNGKHVYSKRFGGAREDFGTGIAADYAGNVVVTGEYTDSVDFGEGLVRTAMGYDIFVAKFDPTGKPMWSKSFGPLESTDIHGGRSITLDRTGNILLAGDFRDTLDLGGGPLQSAGSYDVFVAKYDPSGEHVWSKRFGDTAWDTAEGIATDGVGNVLVAGGYEGTVDFGGGPLPSAGGFDGFVLALDSWGNYLGAKAFGDKRSQNATSITSDFVGHVFVTGAFEGTLDFGDGPLQSAGEGDVFFAKLTN